MDAAEFRRARKTLGLTGEQMATALGLGPHGRRTVQRIEGGGVIRGPMRLAVAKLLDDHNAQGGRP